MARTEEEHQTVRGAEEENKTDSLETTRSTTTTDKTAVSVKRRARERAREIRLFANVARAVLSDPVLSVL